jgi:hypothetical protein
MTKRLVSKVSPTSERRRSERTTRSRVLAIAVLAAAVMVTGAIPAHAAKSASVLTDDGNPSGKAIFTLSDFNLYTYDLKACDLHSDGYGTVAYASFHKGGRENRAWDPNSKGGCVRQFVHIRNSANLGRKVYVTVCLHNREKGHRYCDYNVGST